MPHLYIGERRWSFSLLRVRLLIYWDSRFIGAVDRRQSQQSSALISILILLLIYTHQIQSVGTHQHTLYIYYIEMSRQQAEALACYKIFCPVASLF